MEIPRYWRNRKQRYSLSGDYDPDTNTVAFPPGPNRPRFSLNGNGHKEENPFTSKVIYKAPQVNIELVKSD